MPEARVGGRAEPLDRSGVLDEVAAVRLLAQLGELDMADVLSGAVQVANHSRRCRCLIVHGEHLGWVIKQGTAEETYESVRNEAVAYECFSREPGARFVPRLVHSDRELGVLVVDYVSGATLRDAGAAGDDDERVRIATVLGSVLAQVHGFDSGGVMPVLPPPAIFKCTMPTLKTLEFHSAACLELIRLIQARPRLCRDLDLLSRTWSPTATTHNDIRSDNLLVDSSGDHVVVIDWELAGRGDPYWDLAGPLAEQVSWWLGDRELWSSGSANDSQVKAAGGLLRVHRFTNAFLASYAAGHPPDLVRLMHWCAARLVQTAFESVYRRPLLTPAAQQLLQIASNVFQRPTSAARLLFGLEATDAG